MAALVTRRVRRSQPSPGESLSIDWSNPITRDMTVCMMHADQAYGFASATDGSGFPSAQVNVAYTAGVQANTVQGTGGRPTGGAPMYTLAAKGAIDSPNYSLFAFGTCTSTSVTQSALDMDNSSERYFQFRVDLGKLDFIPFNTSGGNTGRVTASVAMTAAEMSRGFTIGATASPSRTAGFQNGVYIAGAAVSALKTPDTKIPISVGARATNTQQWGTGALMLVVVWRRTLADAEMQALADNPWQLFEPPPRRLYLAWSASSGMTIAASTGVVSVQGVPAVVSAPTIISAAVGSTLVQGVPAQVVTPTNIAANTGTVLAAGQTASIVTPAVIVANTAGVSVTGLAAQIVTPAVVSCMTGAVSVQGQPATVSSGNGIACTTATVSAQGLKANVMTGAAINCATASVSVQGKNASVSASATISCTTAAVAVAGLAATIAVQMNVPVRAAAVIVQGLPADVVTPDGIACSIATIVVRGQPASITSGVRPLVPNPHRTYTTGPRGRAYVGQKRVRTI